MVPQRSAPDTIATACRLLDQAVAACARTVLVIAHP